MKRHIPYYISCLLALICCFTACTEDSSFTPADESEGGVVFAFSIGTSERAEEQTRAAEDGWDDWNENTIEKVDMYIFRTGTTPKHLTATADDLSGGTTEYTWTPANLTRGDIQVGDEIYVVANCESSDLATVNSIEDLKALIVDGLDIPGKQTSFLMDGYTNVENIDAEATILVTVSLKRAAAKIRLTFASHTDWEDVSYRFCQYATNSTVLDLDENSYLGENAGITTYPSASTENSEPMEPVKDDDLYTYGNKEYLVLYSYANDWFDETKADQINQVEPIVENRQTYILLYAPFGEGVDKEWYYYKVPVNFRLPTYNDDAIPNEDDGYDMIDPDNYRHLYRLQRNYIYDITVTIDRPGGTLTDPGELANLTYEVNPWEREDVTVNYEDNLSYTSQGWEETGEQGDFILEMLSDGRTVHFLNTEAVAELLFTINTPVVATWRAQLTGADINYFTFVDADGNAIGTTASGVASEDGENPIPQYIRIKCVEPESADAHSVVLHVYADIAGLTYELDLTDPDNEQEPGDSDDPINRFTILQSY